MPLFNIDNHASGTNLVSFHGRVTFGRETERCRQRLKELLEQGDRRFVFDLSDVEYVDSAGIGFLVTCLTTLGQAGAQLRLTSLPHRVKHVLSITRLNTVFEIFPSQEQALKNFD
jgi:anti-sigma B factor antagonist